MRMRLVTFILFATAAAGRADTDVPTNVHTSEAGRVSVDVPSSWKVAVRDDSVLSFTDPTNEVGVLLVVVDGAELERATHVVDEKLGHLAVDVSWKSSKRAELNGLRGLELNGSAIVDGREVVTGAVILETPSHKGLIVLGMVRADRALAHLAEVKALFRSLRPVE